MIKIKNKFIQITIIMSILCLILSISPTLPAQAGIPNNLEITNLAGTKFDFTPQQISVMPKTLVTADLLCYGRPVVSGNWGGVSLSYLLNLTQATPEVLSLYFVASDGYTVTIPIDLAMQPQVIIAYELNNEFLPQGLRLILDGYNGAAWIAEITSITMNSSQARYPDPNMPEPTIASREMPSSNTPLPRPQQQITASPQPTTTPNPTNVTNPNQPTAAPQLLNNEKAGTQLTLLYAITSTLVIMLVVIGGLAYRYKKHSLKTGHTAT